jgi:hypothetical protein
LGSTATSTRTRESASSVTEVCIDG